MTDQPHNSSADLPPATGGAAPGASPDAPFDDLLRTAMLARPQPAAPADLALRAIALATADKTVRLTDYPSRLLRPRLWAQIASIAATLLIVALLAGAARHMWTDGDIAAIASAGTADSASTSDDSTAADSDSSASTSGSASVSSTTSTIAVVLVAELLVLGVVLLSLSRRTPTMPWGAEALAGLW
jgi:hypothetical protein